MIKIKRIKFYNHHIFNNQEFEFSLENGEIANNIIFAGKNGVGKTKLLEEIDNMLRGHYFITPYDIFNNRIEIELLLDDNKYYDIDTNNPINKVILIMAEKGIGDYGYYAETYYNNNIKTINVKKKNDHEKINYINFNSIYSSVDINYKPREMVRSVTDKKLDEEYISLPLDIAEEIIQLLVDISSQDNNDLARWVKENKNMIVPEEIQNIRTKRFTNAFDLMFKGELVFDGIKDNIIPVFKKNEKVVDITELSSGEKQIIFRGTYLLKNKNSITGNPIIIDEPEISMHPVWEEKIFDYYNNLFIDNRIQTSQMFFATHSEHVLSSVLNKKDSLVIKLDNKKYEKYSKNTSGIILPTMSIAEIKYLIFDIYTIDFHNLLYGYIQNNLVNPIEEVNVGQTDKWLIKQGVSKKEYQNINPPRNYKALQTYIRNCIDHPDDSHSFSLKELKKSINEMLNII